MTCGSLSTKRARMGVIAASCSSAAALLATGCAPDTGDATVSGTATRPDAASVPELPATYVGVLPCADCPGIEYHLDLFPESAYYLKQTYLERDASIDRIGAWSSSQESATLTLFGESDELTRLRIVGRDTLRLLDREGRDIESSLNYELARVASFDPATLELPLRGMYRYMADAGLFVECESGRRFNVAQEGDNAALERAYLAARRQPGDGLLVSLDGRITMRPPMEGAGLRPTLIPDRFTGVWPAETCGARMSLSELLGTNWVLTRIGDETVIVPDGARESRFVLQGGQVSGFGGCNNFNGGFETSGQTIRFGPLAATTRACVDDMDRESAFFSALGSAASYRLFRHHLELFDSDRDPLARFEARELY